VELKAIKLPPSQRFVATRRAVRQTFGDADDLSAWFGVMMRTHSFPARIRHNPPVSGTIVASLSVSSDRHGFLRFYPIARSAYSDDATAQFAEELLPRLKSWFLQQRAKPETAIRGGTEELLVEWRGGKHHVHEFRYR